MQGRNTEALKLLQPVCDQFKESVDVADLRNARALLRCLKHELNQKKPGERFSRRAATPDREYNLNVYGYSCAQTMVAVLTASGDDLTRENVMKQAASIHNEKLPMLRRESPSRRAPTISPRSSRCIWRNSTAHQLETIWRAAVRVQQLEVPKQFGARVAPYSQGSNSQKADSLICGAASR
jgi:hypothetical protein